MRRAKERQMKIGQVPIGKIQFDLRSRDEIPKILIGLQQLYCNEEIREKVFQELIKLVPEDIDPNNGRPGMDLWRILVLGTVRLSCNWDYDKLTDIANNHKTLRLMLGHSDFGDESRYALQTLKDNVSLFRPEALEIGLIGLLILLLMIVQLMRMTIRVLTSGSTNFGKYIAIGSFVGIVSVMTHGVAEHVLYNPKVILNFWLLVGINCAVYEVRRQNESTDDR